MWRVSHIYIVPEAGDIDVDVPCVHFSGRTRTRLYNMTVRLEDDNSGDVAVLEGYEWRTAALSKRFLTWDKMLEKLQEYNPYGFVLGPTGSNYMLVAVDDVSYKFLDYIERIVHAKLSDSEKSKILSTTNGFSFADRDKSLVDVNPSRGIKRAFPLFQAMCFAPAGWMSDGYYMSSEHGNSFYRVEFTNISEARAFSAKHVVSGYGNPMLKGIGVVRSQAHFIG